MKKICCSDIQNEILLENFEKVEEHINSCENCRNFFIQYKNITDLKPNKTECPSSIEFENLFRASREKEQNIFNIVPFKLKYASLLAAAMLIMIIYLPKNFTYKDRPSSVETTASEKIKTYDLLSEGINKEMINIDSIIQEMEMNLSPGEKTLAFNNASSQDKNIKKYALLTEGINNETKNIDTELKNMESDLYSDESIYNEIELLTEDINEIKEG